MPDLALCCQGYMAVLVHFLRTLLSFFLALKTLCVCQEHFEHFVFHILSHSASSITTSILFCFILTSLLSLSFLCISCMWFESIYLFYFFHLWGLLFVAVIAFNLPFAISFKIVSFVYRYWPLSD